MLLRCTFPVPLPPMVHPWYASKSPTVPPVTGIGLLGHPRNCRRVLAPQSLNPHNFVTVVTLGPSCFRRVSKVPTVTGIGVFLIVIHNCRHFWPVILLSQFKIITRVSGIRVVFAVILATALTFRTPYCCRVLSLNSTHTLNHRDRGGHHLI